MNWQCRVKNDRPSLLDLAFVQRPEEVREIECFPPLGNNDHCVIQLPLTTSGINLLPTRWIKQLHRVDASAVELHARELDWSPHESDEGEGERQRKASGQPFSTVGESQPNAQAKMDDACYAAGSR